MIIGEPAHSQLDVACPAKKAAMQAYFDRYKRQSGTPCSTSWPPDRRPHCAPVADDLADVPTFQVHPHAFWGQRGMAGMIMNLHAKLPQLRTFCDVGANYGHFTHEFLARWGGGGAGASRRRGLAIEPLPHNARVLRRRFKSDRRITVVQAAASHADAEPRQ
eukprot:276255-Prymnesium_polylepis.1